MVLGANGSYIAAVVLIPGLGQQSRNWDNTTLCMVLNFGPLVILFHSSRPFEQSVIPAWVTDVEGMKQPKLAKLIKSNIDTPHPGHPITTTAGFHIIFCMAVSYKDLIFTCLGCLGQDGPQSLRLKIYVKSKRGSQHCVHLLHICDGRG